jgi:hypothetical protein
MLWQTVLIKPALAETEVEPTQVYNKVLEVASLVERVRQHMGVPKSHSQNLQISDAQPHDVFFQARTLFHKSNRLLFQITRNRSETPEFQGQVYHLADVLAITAKAQQNLSAVLAELDLKAITLADDSDTTPKKLSDVFVVIQTVNRQINLLLERPFSPSDVFMQVTKAIDYCAGQLARYPEVQRIPKPPEVLPNRVPSDVYFRLLEGLDRLKHLYELQGLSSLSVGAAELHKEDIDPSDVFDIASLLVARLDYLHKHNQIERIPRKPYYPGRVYPTDVFRQTGILMLQLETLIDLYQYKKED